MRIGKKIGIMLVEKGCIARRKISRGFRSHNIIIAATVAVVVAIAAAGQAGLAYAGPAVCKVRISARVIAHSHMKVLYQVSQVRITQADIQRGFIDINSGSRLEVKSNDPHGYIFTFRGADMTPFSAAHVKGNGTNVYIDGGKASARRPYVRGAEMVEFSYRLILSDDAQPGTYAWPITIEVPETHGI